MKLTIVPDNGYPARPLLLVLAGLLMLLVACGAEPGSPRGEEPADPAAVEQALRIGHIVLPPGTQVLGAQADRGIDQLYRLAVAVEPASVEPLLTGSGFTTPLERGRKVFTPGVEGFHPDNGSDIASAEDRLPPQPGTPDVVTREVLVDRTDPARPVVHWWIVGT
ncbi:hypothetical protein [Amycolatopsis suaedae]|uniref:Uncharacterized protein n=1 Tax=Amycolatopsis suaedae TaxID=2510978 RepID=A0A4Q7J5U2_9PSEU|nr:hypothetical protein [Amycolatopsis suaedae]RZQ62146.1 hypothetical protein EWH70_21480 [Amycolatopsis suaedae]